MEPGIACSLTDVPARFGGGGMPLHFVVGGVMAGMVQFLLEWGVSVEVGDGCGMTPMQYVVATKNKEAAGLMGLAEGGWSGSKCGGAGQAKYHPRYLSKLVGDVGSVREIV